MSNNDILKKLRVALSLRNDDIIHILGLVDFKISRSELGALFRSEDHPHFRKCGDQILRNFLNGLVIYMRGKKAEPGKAAPGKTEPDEEIEEFDDPIREVEL